MYEYFGKPVPVHIGDSHRIAAVNVHLVGVDSVLELKILSVNDDGGGSSGGVIVPDCDNLGLAVVVNVTNVGLSIHVGERRAAVSLYDIPWLLLHVRRTVCLHHVVGQDGLSRNAEQR